MTRRVEPLDVARAVEQFVTSEHLAVSSASNRSVLDDSGVYDLHSVAASIYELGFNDGCAVADRIETGRRLREERG